jgi:phosphatidylserine/phosphatidylglycerophosphate/cardiolipin synthase-like enzyme
MSTTALLDGLSNVHIRVKRGSPRDLMHSKVFCVDEKLLREGSANWSLSAEKRQDNVIWTTSDPHLIAAYRSKFDEMWNRPSNLIVQ